MLAKFEINRIEYEITTEHAASSHGHPVLLRNGELTDLPVEYEADESPLPSALDLLADCAGIWGGPQTRRELERLADEMLADVENPNGADCDRVIAEFKRRKESAEEAEVSAS